MPKKNRPIVKPRYYGISAGEADDNYIHPRGATPTRFRLDGDEIMKRGLYHGDRVTVVFRVGKKRRMKRATLDICEECVLNERNAEEWRYTVCEAVIG